jgi:hypothetical protein
MEVSDIIIDGLIQTALSGGGDRVKWTTELKGIMENVNDSKINKDRLAVPGGVATLNISGIVESSQLPPGSTGVLDDLTDVDIVAPVAGQVLTYVGSNWENAAPSSGDLTDLGDVIITTPSVGEVLKWNGTNWVNNAEETIDLGDLTDVDLTGLAIGDVLKWDGSNWIPDQIQDGVLASYTAAAGTVANGDTVKGALQKLDGNIVTKQNKTVATTGSVISFSTDQVYNSPGSPSSSNITDDLTGAIIGVVQKIYSNKVTAPTFPAGWVLIGSGEYVTSVLNIIYAEWISGTRVEYWITQEQ